MENLCNELSLFLSNLDDTLFDVLNPNAVKFIENAQQFTDINNIILYGNSKVFLEATFELFIKRYFNISKIQKKQTELHDLPYLYSDYHFEFDFTDKYTTLIKSLVENRSISNRQVIILLKNIDLVSKIQQQCLRRILEKYSHVKFFMTCKTLSDIDYPITSRSLLMNLNFPVNRICSTLQRMGNGQFTLSQIEEMFKKNNNNIISTIIYISNNCERPKVEQYILSFLKQMTKERNHINVIMNIRELCYKLYHLNVELSYICKVVIANYDNHKKLPEIVSTSSELEAKTCIHNKNIIIYEKYFLEIYKIIKGI